MCSPHSCPQQALKGTPASMVPCRGAKDKRMRGCPAQWGDGPPGGVTGVDHLCAPVTVPEKMGLEGS